MGLYCTTVILLQQVIFFSFNYFFVLKKTEEFIYDLIELSLSVFKKECFQERGGDFPLKVMIFEY